MDITSGLFVEVDKHQVVVDFHKLRSVFGIWQMSRLLFVILEKQMSLCMRHGTEQMNLLSHRDQRTNAVSCFEVSDRLP